MKRGLILGVLILSVVATQISAKAQDVKIEKGKLVKFDYTLKVEGKVLETSEGKQPLEYTQGSGQIIPGLETALEGMKVGDKKTVTIAPKDAYGEVRSDAVKEIPKTSFPKDFTATVGMVVEVGDGKDAGAPATITEVKDNTVVINFNHPLAGKTLEFDVKIIDIKDAPAAMMDQAPKTATPGKVAK